MATDPNLPHLVRVVERLGELADDLMLVGGAAAGLLVDDPAAAPIRTTEDVDLVIEAVTYPAYHDFCRKLEARGLKNAQQPGDPLCRWRDAGIVLDLMPLDEGVLGFSNRWYAPALQRAERVQLGTSLSIRRIDAAHFLASKLAAFHSRGEGDPIMSHDLEDLVVVTEGRLGLVEELRRADASLRTFLAEGIADLLQHRHFAEALQGYFAGSADARDRARATHDRLVLISGRA